MSERIHLGRNTGDMVDTVLCRTNFGSEEPGTPGYAVVTLCDEIDRLRAGTPIIASLLDHKQYLNEQLAEARADLAATKEAYVTVCAERDEAQQYAAECRYARDLAEYELADSRGFDHKKRPSPLTEADIDAFHQAILDGDC